MTATPCEDLAVEPLDSLEVRWMLPGPLHKELLDWFTRFPATTETRYDFYLLRPRLPGLSVKLRNGTSLDVKSYCGSRGTITVPGHCRGRLESWRKWSFPYDPGKAEDGRAAGWVGVRKSRRRSWIPLPADRCEAASDRTSDGNGNGNGKGNGLAAAGCAVELTEADPGSQPWWSVGFEAVGSADLLDSALRHAAGLVFGCHFPAVTEFSLRTCRSYAQWLYEQAEAGAMDTSGPGLIRRADTPPRSRQQNRMSLRVPIV